MANKDDYDLAGAVLFLGPMAVIVLFLILEKC